MICTNCGQEAPADANLCPYCGKIFVVGPPARAVAVPKVKKGFGIAAWIITSVYLLYVGLTVWFIYSINGGGGDVGEIGAVLLFIPTLLAATPVGIIFFSLINILCIIFAIVQLCKNRKAFSIVSFVILLPLNLAGIVYNFLLFGLVVAGVFAGLPVLLPVI